MDHADEDFPRLVVLPREIVLRRIDQRRLARMIAHRQQSGGLLNGETMVVLIKDAQRRCHEVVLSQKPDESDDRDSHGEDYPATLRLVCSPPESILAAC